MKVKSSLSMFICLLAINVSGQNEQFTVKGNVNYKNSKGPIRVILSCVDRNNATTYTDSLGNYSLSRNIYRNLQQLGINNGRLECALRFELPDYKQCGHCPYIQREQTTVSDKSRRISIPLDSLVSEVIINVTITEEMIDEHLPSSIFFNKNSTFFTNYFSSDTLLDCVADYLLNCKGCFMEIAAYADDDEDDKNQLSEQRAEKIYNLLVKRGVNPELIKYKGYADTKELNSNRKEINSDNKRTDRYRADFFMKQKEPK